MLDALERKLAAEGYACQRGLDLGPASASLHARKHVCWWLLPFTVSYYVFDFEDERPIDLAEVVGYDAIARARTFTERRPSSLPWLLPSMATWERWWRTSGVDVCITILSSHGGFTDRAVREVHSRSMSTWGLVSIIILVERESMEIHAFRRVVILGCAVIDRAIREATAYLRDSASAGSFDAIA